MNRHAILRSLCNRHPYLIASVIAVGFTVTGKVVHSFLDYNPVIFVMTGIIAAAWVGGSGPGALASVFVAFLVRPLFGDPQTLSFDYGGGDLLRLAFFLALTGFVSYLIGARKRAEAGLMASNAELENRVQERTADLVAANRELQRSNEALAQERARVQAANDELERLNKDLEQFMYSASHDLREPIRNVLIYTQLLERRYGALFDDKGKEYLAIVTGGAGRLDRLLSDLLSYSRLAGPQAEEAEVADSNMALASAQADLGEVIRQTGATIHSETLPSVRIRQGNLEQLFLNLLGNGLKYRSDEPPVLHVSWQQEGAFCCFAITDNGIGIEPDYQDKIFGLFKRLHRDTEYPGTGIGLAICKRVVERYGGRIWVHSQPGGGSTFYFTVPMAAGAVAVAGASTISQQRVL